jgi:hypothetical protein
VEHERVGVGTQLGDDERHLLRHQAAYEVHVTGQAIELGDDDRALGFSRSCERSGKFRAAVQRIGAFAGLDLDVLADEIDSFGLGKPLNGRSLCINAEPAFALLGS